MSVTTKFPGHAWFMEHALAQARIALERNEVPIGAIVVDENGVILSSAYNQVEQLHTQRAHAESLAMEMAAQKRKDWRLAGCWVYVTLEPCAMCMYLAMLSRVKGVVFGAPSPLFGYHLDNVLASSIYQNHALEIISNVCSNESSNLLKQFFQQKR